MRVCEVLFPPQTNVWRFNPSIAWVKDDLYVMCYRTIRYALPDGITMHPWELWAGKAQKYSKVPDSNTQARELVQDNLVKSDAENISRNHRASLGPAFTSNFTLLFESQFATDTHHDGTSVTFIRIPSHFTSAFMLAQEGIVDLFGDEMNHDCRVQYIPQTRSYKLTYNGFIRKQCNNPSGIPDICMLTRDMGLSSDGSTRNVVTLSDERYCSARYVEHFKSRTEKNWSYIVGRENDTYIYQLARQITFVQGTTGNAFHTTCDVMGDLMDRYGHRHFIFSPGTPTVQWGAGYLSCGHLKVAYKDKDMPAFPVRLQRLLDSKLNSLGKLHGKFLYFMFFMRLDSSLNVTHLSNAFIPTDTNETSHSPFALVFPCGLHVNNSNHSVIVSYGEGDVRCKLLTLSNQEMHRLLVPVNAITPGNYDFYLTSTCPRKIAAFGYYNRNNTGDDCFKYVLSCICKKWCPGTTITFINPDEHEELDNDISLVVIGGGDIVSTYFTDRIRDCVLRRGVYTKAVMLSVGTPYPSAIKPLSLNFVQYTITRNIRDTSLLADATNAPCDYFPDMVHLLPHFISNPTDDHKIEQLKSRAEGRLLVAFCLTRTIFHPDYSADYFNMLYKLARVILRLTVFDRVHAVLIPFGVHKQSDKENDVKFNKQLAVMMHGNGVRHFSVIQPDTCNYDFNNPEKYISYIDQTLSHMDFAVCARFHAHVFCMNRDVPFVSLGTTRKVRELLRQWDLSHVSFVDNFEISPIMAPVDFDIQCLYDHVSRYLSTRETLKLHIAGRREHTDASSHGFMRVIVTLFNTM